ncbi:MAG TPA: hypothetical protein VLB27_11305, partial [candidate division Zixibacteria bacterium]|nr:hypothetical protein [candidate division Zixibacteria bacterium]
RKLATALALVWLAQAGAAAAGNCNNCLEFRTDRDSAASWLRDGDPREASPTQKRGTVTALTVGEESALDKAYHLIFTDTLASLGDVNADGSGMAAGVHVAACTLWVKVVTMPAATAGDSWTLDLFTVDEPWNEDDGNAVSWNNRVNDTAWTTAGVSGTLACDNVFTFEYRSADTFVWFTDVAGSSTLWDTVSFAAGDSLPIPLAPAVYRGMRDGSSFGAALKLDTAASVDNKSFKFGASESSNVSSRPQFQWVYAGGKVAVVDDNPTSLGADTLLVRYLEDSLTTADGLPFTVVTLLDDTAHAQRNNPVWWDSLDADLVIWTGTSFGGNNNAPAPVPVLTFNRSQVSAFGLGSGNLNSTPGKKLLNNKSHWLTSRYPGDTLYPVSGSNVTFRQCL